MSEAEVRVDSKSNVTGIEHIRESLNKLGDQLKQIGRTAQEIGGSLGKLDASFGSTKTALSGVTEGLRTHTTEAGKAVKVHGELITGYEQTSKAANKLRKDITELSQAQVVGPRDWINKVKQFNTVLGSNKEVGQFRASMNSAGQVVANFDTQLSKAQKNILSIDYSKRSVDSLATSIVNIGKNWQWVGRQITMGLSLPIFAAGTKAVQEYVKWNEALARTEKYLIDINNTPDGLIKLDTSTFHANKDKIVKDLTDISHEWATNRALLGQLSGDFASAGFGMDQVTVRGLKAKTAMSALTEATAKYSTLADLDVGTTKDALLNLIGVYAKGAQGVTTYSGQIQLATQIMDEFSAIDAKTRLRMDELAKAFPEVAGSAKVFNLSAGQTAAVLAGFVEQGVPATEAAHAMKFAFSRMQDPTTQAAKQLKQWNIELFNSAGAARPGLEVLGEIAQKLLGVGGAAGATDQEVAQFFGDTVGRRQVSRVLQGLTSIQNYMNGTGDKASAMASDMGKALQSISQDSVQAIKAGRDADIQSTEVVKHNLSELSKARTDVQKQSPAMQWKQFKADFTTLMQSVGESISNVVLPKLQLLLHMLAKLVEGFNSLPQAARSFLVFGGIITAALGPLLMLKGVFAQSFGVMLGWLNKLRGGADIIARMGPLEYYLANAHGDLHQRIAEQGQILLRTGNEWTLIADKAGAAGAKESLATIQVTKAIEAQTAAQARLNTVKQGAPRGPGGQFAPHTVDYKSERALASSEVKNTTRAVEDLTAAQQVAKTEAEQLARKEVTGAAEGAAATGLLGKAITKLRGLFTSVGEEATAAKAPLSGLGSVGGPIIASLGGALSTVTTALSGIAEGVAVSLTGPAGLTGAMASLTTPIGWVAAAIALIAVPIIAIATHWDKFYNNIKQGLNEINKGFKAIGDALSPIAEQFGRLQKLLESKDGSEALNHIGDALSWIASAAGKAFGFIFSEFGKMMQIFKPVIQIIGTALGGILETLVNVIKVVINLINGNWIAALKSLGAVFIGVLSTPIRLVELIADQIVKLFSGLLDHAKVIAHVIDEVLGSNLEGKINDAKKSLDKFADTNYTDKAKNAIKDMIGIKDGEDAAGKWNTGWGGRWNGWKRQTVQDAKEVSNGIADAISSAGDSIQKLSPEDQKTYITQFKSLVDKQVDKMVKSASDAFDRMAERRKKALDEWASDQQRAFDHYANAQKKALDKEINVIQKSYDKWANAQKQALDDQTNAQKQALDDQTNAQKKALDEQLAQEAKAFDKQQALVRKAFDKQQQIEERAFSKQQDARRKALDDWIKDQEKAFDKMAADKKKALDDQERAEIASIDAQIKAIDDIQKAEQKALRDEEYRTRRLEMLRKMQEDSENYLRDRAIAIYEGRVDDARKMDLEHIKNSADAQKSIKDLDDQHNRDLVQDQRDAQKQALDDQKQYIKNRYDLLKTALDEELAVQKEALINQLDAQRAAFDEQLQAEKDAYDERKQAQKDAFDERLQGQKDAFGAQQQLQKEALDRQIQDQKQALDRQIQDQKDALNESLNNQKDAMNESLNAQKEGLDNKLAMEKEALDRSLQRKKDALDKELTQQKQNLEEQLQALKDQTPKTEAEMQERMNKIHDLLAAQGVDWKWQGENAGALWNQAITGALEALQNSNWWEVSAWNEVMRYLGGAINAGKATINNISGSASAAENATFRHSGGPIGSAAETASDVPATLQVGEYVVQRSAVKSLGLGIMNMINQGHLPSKQKFHLGGYMAPPTSIGDAMSGIVKNSGFAAGQSFLPPILNYFVTMIQGAMAQMAAAPFMGSFGFHEGGLVTANPDPWSKISYGLPSLSMDSYRSDASRAAMAGKVYMPKPPSFVTPAPVVDGSNPKTYASTSDGTVVIEVENFIGQPQWFEGMMKEYDIKIRPRNNRTRGKEGRVIDKHWVGR